MTFKTTKVSGSAKKLKLTGDLTLRGKTRSITVDATLVGEGKDPWGGYRAGWNAELTFKRSDFGMDYMQGGLGDVITVRVGIEAIKK